MTRNLVYLPRFIGYALRHFPLARVVIVLSLVLLALEYVLLSVMIPLSGQAPESRVVELWHGIASGAGLPTTQVTWLWFFLVLTAATMLVGYLHIVLSMSLSKQLHRHLSSRIFHRVLFDEEMIEIYRRSIGYYVTLAGDDTYRAGTIINSAAQMLAGAASALAAFVLLYLFSPKILVAMIVFLAMCAALVGWGFRVVARASQRSVDLSREVGTAYIEALNGLRSIRSMSAERYVHESYVAQTFTYVRWLLQIDVVRHGMKVAPALLLLTIAALALWPTSARVEGITVSFFLALATVLMRVFTSLGQTVNFASTLLLDVRAAKDINELIRDSAPAPRPAEAADSPRIRSVALRDVTFRYDETREILTHFSFQFDAGKSYAIVGRSGSGKSTLADIMLGLVTPTSGSVFVNDRPAAQHLRKERVVLVEQQARVFSASVRENLLLGLSRSDDAIWEALRSVDLESHVRALPSGLDTSFHYQGANLSGGQRQRLGIARALLRRPDVLILDEATSALDVETRRIVVAQLRAWMQEGILIFITHERAISEQADVVLELSEHK